MNIHYEHHACVEFHYRTNTEAIGWLPAEVYSLERRSWAFLDSDDEEAGCDDGLDDVFFPGSDDELGFLDVEEEDDRYVRIDAYKTIPDMHCISVVTI